jgi:hypothetical protein
VYGEVLAAKLIYALFETPTHDRRDITMATLIRRVLTFHWVTTLILMGVFALSFGLTSLNLFMVLHANLELIAAHGIMALRDGALAQLAELIGYGYLSVISFVLFKACEKVLIEYIFY